MPRIFQNSTGIGFPLEVTQVDDTVHLKYSVSRAAFKEVLADVKSLEGARWNPENKTWSAKHPAVSGRNSFIFGFLTDAFPDFTVSNPFDRYTAVNHFTPQRDTLRAHQKEIHSIQMNTKRVVIGAEMGTGKTLPTIETIEKVLEQVNGEFPGAAVLVVCPKIATYSWPYEMAKWKAKYSANVKIIVNSPQAIRRYIDEAELPPVALIIDEADAIKNTTTQRWKLLNELQFLMWKTWKGEEYVICMTGTPAPHDPTNWWGLCEIARPGFIRENSVNKFRERLAYLETKEGPHGTYKQVIGWNAAELTALPTRLKGLVYIKLKKDCLDLPDKIYQQIDLPMSPETINAAKMVVASDMNPLVKLVRLREISDGFFSREIGRQDNGDGIYEIDRFATPKEEALIDLLQGRTRIVVYAGFTESVDRVTQICIREGFSVLRVDGRGWHAFAANGFLPGTNQAQFQDRDLDKPLAFVGNAASGGMAITLTASDTIVYYSNSFNGRDRMQSEDRIHRIGSKGANIIDLIHLPTDRLILDNLQRKKDIQAVTMGDIAECLERVKISELKGNR